MIAGGGPVFVGGLHDDIPHVWELAILCRVGVQLLRFPLHPALGSHVISAEGPVRLRVIVLDDRAYV